MTQVVQDPYAMQKMAGYPNATKVEQPIVPGNVQGETVDEFAQGKFNNGRPNLFAPVQKPASTEAPKKVITDSKPVPSDMETGNRISNPIRNTDELAAAMDYTTPEQEERLRKASVANQRIMAVADALRHIGNIANTVNYAPSQQFNNPVLEEQARYEKGKAMRDKANQIYLTYQQQKAEQDRKARQWEAEQQAKRDQWNATFRYNAARDAASLAEKARQADQTLAFNKDRQKATEERWKRQDEETRSYHRAQTGLGYARLNETKRHNGVMESNRTPTKTKTGGGNGYIYSTKNGSVTIPADYLSKNKINRISLLTAMERAGAVDKEWRDNFDRAIWNKEMQDEMLDDAMSNWLMTDDAAEEYMVKHLKGQSAYTDNSKQHIEGFGGGGGKERIAGFGGY